MNRLLAFWAAAAAIAAAGCSNRASSEDSPAVEPAALYEEGRGLRLPSGVRRSLGVETVEVAVIEMPRRVRKRAEVFRESEGARPASAVVMLAELELAGLETGKTVVLREEGVAPKEFAGRLARLNFDVRGISGYIEAILEFEDAEGRVRAGSSLMAALGETRIERVFAVPGSALIEGVEMSFVYTENGAHFTRTLVKRGAELDGWIEVMEGIYEGDRVVSHGAEAMWMIELYALKGGTPCCPVPGPVH